MNFHVCSVRDRALDAFGAPMFVRAIGEAVRGFTDEICRKDDNNQLYRHPEDFDLYVLGKFDSENGLFTTDVPRMICVGKDVHVSQ